MTKMIDQVNDLIKFNKSVEKLYKILYDLEIAGQKDSKEYMEYLGVLESAVEIINKKMNQLGIHGESLIKQKELIESFQEDDENDIIIQSINGNSNDPVNRIINQIYEVCNRFNIYGMQTEEVDVEEYSRHGIIKTMNDEFDDEDEEDNKMSVEEKDFNDKSSRITYDIEEIKDILIANTMITYLLQAIDEETDIEVKNILISYKYKVIYFYNCLERNFVNNPDNFTRLYLAQQLLKAKYAMQPEDYDEEYYVNIRNTIEETLITLHNVKKKETTTPEEIAKLKFKIIYIKTYLSIIYDKKIFKKMKKLAKTLKDETKSKFARESIDECFNIPEELSLRNKIK